MKAAAVGLLLAALASGCLGAGDAAAPAATPTAAEDPAPAPRDPALPLPPAQAPGVPLDLVLNDCTGWYTVRNHAGQTAPGSRPGGWDAAPPDALLTGIGVEAYDCARLSLGPFERPVRLLLESHGNAAFPPACTAELPGFTVVTVLVTAWVDDPEVGAFLAERYGMPVQVGPVERAEEAVGDGTLHTWTWGLEGATPSSLAVLEAGPAGEQGLYHRMFWSRGGGIARLDLDLADVGTVQLPDSKRFQPPMVMASDTGGQGADPTQWLSSREAAGRFTFYDDLACGVPA